MNDPFRIGEDRISGVVTRLVAALLGLTLVGSALLFNGVNHSGPGLAAAGLGAATHENARLAELWAVAGWAAGLPWAAGHTGRTPYGSSRDGYAGDVR